MAAFAALCILIFLAGGLELLRCALLARRISKRLQTLAPQALLSNVQRVPGDVARIQSALEGFAPLSTRAGAACLSITQSVVELRAQAFAMREAFRHLAG